MSDIVKKTTGLMGLIHGGEIEIPKPFEREIFLFDTHVAGTTHVENILELEPMLNIGDKLLFVREPENQYDPQAIRVMNMKKEKIGYVPMQDNIVFSRLMDAGKKLYGRIKSKEMIDEWLKIEMDIYLND